MHLLLRHVKDKAAQVQTEHQTGEETSERLRLVCSIKPLCFLLLTIGAKNCNFMQI